MNQRKQLQISIDKDKERNSVYQLIDGWEFDKITQAKVMVVGAGALGNEVLKNLALLSIGNILIVDFDIIETSNLSRSVLFRESDCDHNSLKSQIASERIKEINPKVKLMTIEGDILIDVGLGVFRRMDVIIGCLDNRLARMHLNRHCFKVDKTWIDGGLSDFAGEMTVFKPGVSCYECNMSDEALTIIQEKAQCGDIARRYASIGRIATTPITSSVIAALQVQEGLKVIQDNQKHLMAGKRFSFFGNINDYGVYDVEPPHIDRCFSVFQYDEITESPLSAESTLKDVFAWIRENIGDQNLSVGLDNEFVLKAKSEKSGKIYDVNKAKLHCDDDFVNSMKADFEDRIQFSKTISEVNESFENQEMTLKQLGIPYLHIIRIYVDGEEKYLELSGDASFLNFQ